MQTAPAPVRLLTAKELSREFAARGVDHHEDYFRALLRACPHTVRGTLLPMETAWAWWIENPKWRPYGRKARPAPSFA